MSNGIYETIFLETENIRKKHEVSEARHVEEVIKRTLTGENKNKIVAILKSEDISDISVLADNIRSIKEKIYTEDNLRDKKQHRKDIKQMLSGYGLNDTDFMDESAKEKNDKLLREIGEIEGELTEEIAEKILKAEGYKVEKFLGQGACSIVFKCVNPKNKPVAAKVCLPVKNAWADLEDELIAARELKQLKQNYKAKIQKSLNESNLPPEEAKRRADKEINKFYRYLAVPKLKNKFVIGNREIAIFEARLADSDAFNAFKKQYFASNDDVKDAIYEKNKWFTQINWNKVTAPNAKISVNHKELKRAAKHNLKGLKLLHEGGKSHGDIASRNSLAETNTKKNNSNYPLTDFGTMKDVNEKRVSDDLFEIGFSLAQMWYAQLGGGLTRAYIDDIIAGRFDERVSVNMYRSDGDKYRGYEYGGWYFLDQEDKKLIAFCKRLFTEKGLTAAEALKDDYLTS